jgi:hypothetical protein
VRGRGGRSSRQLVRALTRPQVSLSVHAFYHHVGVEPHGTRICFHDAVEVDALWQAPERVGLEGFDLGELDLGALRYLFPRQSSLLSS